MTSPSATCPNPQCGCPVQPTDRFCPFCGQVLAAGGGESPRESITAAARGPQTPVSASEASPPQLTAVLAKIEQKAQCDPPAQLERPAVVPAASAHSDCPDLEALYNNSCVFVLNMQSTFDFELRPLVDGLRDLFIEVRQSGQVIARETPLAIPKRGVPLPLSLNYTPRHTLAGRVSFTIVIGYRKDGQPRLYACCRTHTIYSGKEDARQVCESLVVEVKNNIQQGHAGDLRVDQNFRELREALRQRNTIELDKEFLDLINARPFWTPLALAECAPEAVAGAAFTTQAHRARRLVLHGPANLRVHVLTDCAVRLGRHRSCEIVSRVLDADGHELREESLHISQFHAQIQWQGDQCVLRDGGLYPEKGWRPSGAGVWVDGKRLPAGGDWRFAAGREHRIALGEDGQNAFVLSARLYTIGEMPIVPQVCSLARASQQSPACLVLRRLQGPKWVYVALRACAALVWADSRCGRACLCACPEGIQFSNGQTCNWLIPAQEIRAGSVDFRVLEDQTTHLPATKT